MQPIQINVQVNIGMDSALIAMLSGLIGNRQEAAPAAVAAPPKKKAEAKPKQVKEPAPAATEEPANEEPAAEVPAAEAAPAPEEPAPAATEEPAAEEQAKEYTEVDIRAAMDRTRRRIEGEDYKENTNSEGYKKWHRQLTGWFKNTAAIFGAEKPSALPDSQSRAGFIASCDRLVVKNDELTEEDCPF